MSGSGLLRTPREWSQLKGTMRARAAVAARLKEISPLAHWRERGVLAMLGLSVATLVQALKIALSAGLSWALAQLILGSPSPIWAPLTASLIALLTVRDSVRDALQKILAVLIGMVVAIWLGGLIGLHAWSISIIVGLGFLLGKMLRLTPGAAAQIPINGLFILALGSGQSVQRIWDTLIGAAVAVLINLVIIPPNHVNAARRAVQELSDEIVDLLSVMAAGIAGPWRRDQAAGWLREARAHGNLSQDADGAVDQAEQSLRLHPNRSSWVGPLGAVRRGNRTLHTVELQVRVLARTLRDIADDLPPDAGGRQPPLPMAADMLTSTAAAISAFADAHLREDQPEDLGADTRAAINRTRAAIRAITADLHDMVAANLARGIYLGTLVVETGRILDEIEAGLPGSAESAPDAGPASGPPPVL